MTAPTLPPSSSQLGRPEGGLSDRGPTGWAGLSPGRLLVGGLLVALGLAWLAGSTGALELRWQTVLSLAVLLTGAAVLATARSGRGDGLIALGVVLCGALAVATAAPSVPLQAGAGDRQYRPASVADLDTRYELGFGNLLLDLRGPELPAGTTDVEVRVGLGQITVLVPSDVAVQAEASAGAGELAVLGTRRSGLSPRLEDRSGSGERVLSLDLQVGTGSIEVTR
jgi:hypothetical protein